MMWADEWMSCVLQPHCEKPRTDTQDSFPWAQTRGHSEPWRKVKSHLFSSLSWQKCLLYYFLHFMFQWTQSFCACSLLVPNHKVASHFHCRIPFNLLCDRVKNQFHHQSKYLLISNINWCFLTYIWHYFISIWYAFKIKDCNETYTIGFQESFKSPFFSLTIDLYFH